MKLIGNVERLYFYPRSPHGKRLVHSTGANNPNLFLSTLPSRGATRIQSPYAHPQPHFYPRSPRGERPWIGSAARWIENYFYPRSPRGERHVERCCMLTGGDFYPRSPRGERPSIPWTLFCCQGFLSTLPSRRATPTDDGPPNDYIISIHAPLAGSDPVKQTFPRVI